MLNVGLMVAQLSPSSWHVISGIMADLDIEGAESVNTVNYLYHIFDNLHLTDLLKILRCSKGAYGALSICAVK
jgi:hypothetical protein